jgi:hypothetical protein
LVEQRTVWRGISVVSLLTLFVLVVHGYHPFVEDGGLYVAGIKKLLDPALYPAWSQFVTEHLRFSLFAPMVAGLVRLTHLSLPWVLLLIYCASIWTTLFAGWMVISRAVESLAGRSGGVALLACWLTMPIAGTSLMLMDPYVTARSFSTPLALFAVAWAMDIARSAQTNKRLFSAALCFAAIAAAAVLHPLMAGYALATVAVILCVGSRNGQIRRWGPWILLTVALLGAAALQTKAPAESANYVWVAMTRYYWFPFRWEWYEQIGLIAPLMLLAILGRRRIGSICDEWHVLVRLGLVLGGIALAVAIAFSRAKLGTHLVARMQPLRSYQMVYEIMILLLGAWIGERILAARAWRWALLFSVFGGLMFFVQRSTFPASTHLEMPWRTPRNPWVRAFLWARDNSASNDLFALDAHYITSDGEDAQTFRAIAERSAVPDYSKDGGEASITPDLTEPWVIGQAAQTNLDKEDDAARLTKLSGLGVNWVILRKDSVTNWSCPYANDTVKVCRMR